MKVLHLDIETAPNKCYTWGLYDQTIGINQIVEPGYTLCWAAKWHGDPEIHFDSVHRSTPRQMCRKIHKLMDEADAIVHYNGKKFDIPTLNREFVLHGLNPPSPAKQIDLLLTCRDQFRFVSNKLDFVAQQLGLGQKVEHKGMDLWRECMDGDSLAWQTMETYNKQDVALLELLYVRLYPWIKGHPNPTLVDGGSAHAFPCPTCGGKTQRRGYAFTSVGRYPRYQCRACGAWSRGRVSEVQKEEKGALLVRAV